MSRIGKMPVPLTAGTSIQLTPNQVSVKGPKGQLSQELPAGVVVTQEGAALVVTRVDDSRQNRANHGLTRALLANMVTGVTKGFERRLDIQGVGFKGEVKGKVLNLSLGYSHLVEVPFPDGITIEVDKGVKLVVKGTDRQLVGETAARLRKLRSPDSYKGKGVRYEGENIRLKAGKTAKK